MLLRIEPTDPTTFVAAAGLISAIVFFASWMPARRAGGVDPAQVLRME